MKRAMLLVICVSALAAILAYRYWPSLTSAETVRIPPPVPVAFDTLPVATRASQLFSSGRYVEFEKMLDAALADVRQPDDIEWMLAATCDKGVAARREIDRWQASEPPDTHLWSSLCLGRAFLRQGLQDRGTGFAVNTAAEKFNRMVFAFDDAYARLIPFYKDPGYRRAVIVPLLTLLQFSGGRDVDATVGDYASLYAASVGAFPRMATLYLHQLERTRPQWGGSIAAMHAFALQVRSSGAPDWAVKRIAASVNKSVDYEQWKGNPQRPAETLEAQIDGDLSADDLELLAVDLDKMDRPESAARARDLAVKRYPNATAPLWRRGYIRVTRDGRRDLKAGYDDFVAAANRGDHYALDRIVTTLCYGEAPVAKDWIVLRPWVEYGVSIGHAKSEQMLGTLYLQGLAGVTADQNKALELYRASARHGYDNGQHDLGAMLLRAAQTDAQRQEAVSWLQAAAQQGHRFASEKLSAMNLPIRSP